VSDRAVETGIEWIVDASGCRPDALRDLAVLQALFERLVRELSLHPAAAPVWKVFDGAGGVTGMVLLSESHLTIHTFPEHGFAAINLYCCTARATWDWERGLRDALGAAHVQVRTLSRVGRVSERGLE
jgi:S-adenosylmethionine decarboxylase